MKSSDCWMLNYERLRYRGRYGPVLVCAYNYRTSQIVSYVYVVEVWPNVGTPFLVLPKAELLQLVEL